MSYIKIVRKISAGEFENYYLGSDVASITLTFTDNSDNTNVTSIAIETVSGVTHTLLLTTGLQADDAQSITQDYMWGRVIDAAKKGPDFAGIAAQIGSGIAGVGDYYLLDGAGAVETTTTLVTIDSDTVS
jgi:hypothetical protein